MTDADAWEAAFGSNGSSLANRFNFPVPAVIANAGPVAREKYIEYFTATIRNANTRRAYAVAVNRMLGWCDRHGIALPALRPTIVATYIEELMRTVSPATVKQHLAAIRDFCDYLVLGQVLPTNPCHAVRGPKHVVKSGKTPVLTQQQARELLDSIEVAHVHPLTGQVTANLIGLRDRALIAMMIYSFARIGAAVSMNVEDYWQNGKRWWFRLHEKGGKHHAVPAHHNAEQYLDAYLQATGIADQLKSPLFRTIPGHGGDVSDRRMTRNDALAMIKRRAKAAGMPRGTCCHTFRATGITAYLRGGGVLENAQTIAAHESPRTTRLYDRRSDEISPGEIERIVI
ncbi:tyrosine-type recombinase/integrase [Humisphaera borealis]|uniref:Tyrosine-type recombinase/integrase n=1 Tax=Humisphaera borealis TaxID=2807512 RepID=A0A7M2X388_9BACT|nr:tyrosine-type recombinase/integrase [Humisphaera borealis]QOV92089.1 tyrosine-type recombinase/integrase [Humisphaera borealis]